MNQNVTIILEYEEAPFPIKEVEIMTDSPFPEARRFEKEGERWVWRGNLAPGEYLYRFLVNGCIELNDPDANVYVPDAEGFLWSYLLVGNDGRRLYNNEDYSILLEDFSLVPAVSDAEPQTVKRTFDLNIDQQAVARLRFSEIKGLHTVTAVWIDPYGALYDEAENLLCQQGAQNDENGVMLWFWIPLETDMTQGRWTLVLLVDGEPLIADRFSIEKPVTYSIGQICGNRLCMNV